MQDNQQLFYRDGTSQLQRLQAALQEGYFNIEERSIEDWLNFAQQYAKELFYYNTENEKAGDWSSFLSGEVKEMVAYLEDPTSFSQQANKQEWFSRPHFVLLLSFLKLLEDHHKPALNQILQNHLDYYYRDILRFKRKPATPDQVFIILELAKNYKKDRFLLPQSTATFAGKDQIGKDLVYTTDEELMINRAQVEALKTIFVNRKLDRFANYSLPLQLLAMVKLALGQQVIEEGGQTRTLLVPGEALPIPDFFDFTAPPEDETIFVSTLAFLNFAEQELNISFANLRKLLRLKQNRDNDENEWAAINSILSTMVNGGSASFANPKDFVQNFTDATAYSPLSDAIYNELQNVNNAYELYEELNFTTTGDYATYKPLEEPLNAYPDIAKIEILRTFISEKFFTASIDPNVLNANANIFHQMMAIRVAIREEWIAMRELLSSIPVPNTEASFSNIELPTFAELFTSKYGSSINFIDSHPSINDIDAYYETLISIEMYYALTAEEVHILLRNALEEVSEARVHELLLKAHQNKRTVIRREALSAIGTDIELLFKTVLGRPESGDNYPTLPNGATTLSALLNQLDSLLFNIAKDASNYIQQQLFLSIADFRFILAVHQDQQADPDKKAPNWQWRRVYRLLEKAERQLRGPFPKTKPEIVHLDGIYAYPDASQALTGNQDEDFPRWRTFGRIDENRLATLGLAIRSNILELTAGIRTITVDIFTANTITNTAEEALAKITAEPDEEGNPQHPFSIEVSGEKDWLPIIDFDEINYKAADKRLRITFKLASDFDPVTALPSDVEGYLGAAPALRILLKYPGMLLEELSAHELLSRFKIEKVDLTVVVQQLTPSLLRNDTAELKAEEAFEPFGNLPKPSSKLYFAHPELVYKQLESLSLKLNWLGTPNWSNQYNNYSSNRTDPNTFIGQVRLFDQGYERKFKAQDADTAEKDIQLFGGSANNNLTISLTSARELDMETQPFPYQALSPQPLADDLFENERYFFLQLGGTDFGHAEYPGLATAKANELSAALSNGPVTDVSSYQVNPPYTPELQNFSISYTASVTGMGSEEATERGALIHIHPFGYQTTEPGQTFLPLYSQEGYLCIGLRDVDPPFDLTLLFQLAEGSADPDIIPPPLDWQYLVNNQWKKIDQLGRIISDGTNGLLNSGIVKIRIPADANTQHSQLPDGLFWLRVNVRTNSTGLNDTIGIHAHAVATTFADNENDPHHLQTPLPPETITKTQRPQPEIRGIQQPYSSFGGHPQEPLNQLNVRVSERLRHKDRALTLWDYERLVLEAFPQVYKVKCLPGEMLADHDLGKVYLIVIPNIIGIRPFDPFEPKLPLNLIQEIQAYLQERAAPQAEVIVRNPIYIQLRIRMSVEFYSNYQAEGKYYLELLHQALLEYLAPWAFDTGADIAIGGKVYPSLIIDFVERLYYVDYVKDFRLIYGEEGAFQNATNQEMQEGLIAPRADAIWVSARTHTLSTTGSSGVGIGYMIVETDFQVA